MLEPLKWLQYGRFPDIFAKFVRVVFLKEYPWWLILSLFYCILYFFFFLTAVVFHGIWRKCLKDTIENTFPWLSMIIYLIKNYCDFCYVLGSSNPFLVIVLFFIEHLRCQPPVPRFPFTIYFLSGSLPLNVYSNQFDFVELIKACVRYFLSNFYFLTKR